MIYTTLTSYLKKANILLVFAFLVSSFLYSQTVTVPSGSVIIDMGVSPQTYDNSIKPYGLVYAILTDHTTPVIWSINPSKAKDGIDFTVDSRNFKGGPFIISEEYITSALLTEINTWEAKGVVTYTTLTDVDVPFNSELLYDISWTINTKNSNLATDYLEYADIPSDAYSFGLPVELGECDDIFVMPHADPTWEDHGILYDWIDQYDAVSNPKGNTGWFWAGCRAVSNIEALVDPLDSSKRMNFLANDPSTFPGAFDGYGLIDADDHDDASQITASYEYNYPADPIMQFIGGTGEAHAKGAEQVYLPYPTGSWRSSTKVGAWDPNQRNVLDGDSPGEAALIAFGPALGDTSRGMVMYEAGHELDKEGTDAEQVAAIRAFFNFSFLSPVSKVPTIVDNTGPVGPIVFSGETIVFDLSATGHNGGAVTYEWSTTPTSAPGSFNNTSISSPTYTIGTVTSEECFIIRVKIGDSCGRYVFKTWSICVYPIPLDLVLVDKTDILCNGDDTGSITVLATGGFPPYTYNLNGGAPQTSPTFNTLSAGVYTVGVEDSLGFTDSISVTLVQPEAISIQFTKINASQSGACLNGEATATPTGGVPPYTYQWSASAGNQTTATAINLPSGAHTVVVTDDNDCILEQGVIIDCVDDCDAVITIDNIVNVLCTGDFSGSASVSASSVANPAALFTFTWNTTPAQIDSGVTTSTISTLGAGVYTVSVTIDNTFCLPVEQSITITEPTFALNVTATSTDESGPATGDGTATANPTGGTPPYTYSWSPGGANTQTITGLSSGIYTVTVIDDNDCTDIATTIVNPGSCLNLAVNASSTPVTCFGDNDGTATAGVTGGVGPFTYSWSPGGQTTQTITSLLAGVYTVTVTDGTTFCTVTSTTTVNQPGLLSSGIAATNVLCFGDDSGSLDLTVTGGTPPYEFEWSPGGEITEDLFNLTAGSYSVLITDANGCTTTDTSEVLQPSGPLALTYTVVDVLCNGYLTGEIDITVTGGTPPYSYVWNNGTFTEDQTNIAAGNYNVTVTDANGCTISENGIIVDEPANALSIQFTKVNATTGQGCTDGEATATVSGGTPPYSYQWSASAGNQTTMTATNLPEGTHVIVVTDDNDCVLEQGVVIDCVNTCDAVISVDNVVDVLCKGDTTGSIDVSASSIANPTATFTFTWNTVPPQIDSGVTSSSLTNIGVGIYTVSVTIDGTVCQPVEQSVSITEPTNFLGVTASSTDESGPATGDGTATASPSGGTPPYEYLWSPGGETTQTITGLSSGVYTVTVTDDNDCEATASTIVNPGSCNNLAVTASATPVTCNGDSDGTVTANITGGIGPFTYSWSPGGQTTQTVTGLPAGTYTVTVTDGTTLCMASSTTTVNQPGVLTSGIAITNVACYGENTGSLDLTVLGGTPPYSFEWSPGAEITEDLFNLTAGTYSVLITDANGCTATNSAEVLQPTNELSLSILSQTDILCGAPSSVEVLATGGLAPYMYVLDTTAPQSSGVFNNVTEGLHSITAIDANGCFTSIEITILKNCTLAIDDINDTFVNLTVSGNVLTNDIDYEGDTQTVTTTSVISVLGVTVAIDPITGAYTYTPPTDYEGGDSFVYSIEDNGNPQATDDATVYIEILPYGGPDNEPPVANADTNITEMDIPVSGNVLVNDFDPDKDPIVVTANTTPTNGNVVINPNGTYTYTPSPGFIGEDTFMYQICDNGTPALCDNALVTIQVLPNDRNITVANDDAYYGFLDTDITGNVMDNDFDPEGDNQVVTASSPVLGPLNGNLVLNPDGTFIYTPNPGFIGTDVFVYLVNDNGTPIANDIATVYLTINDPGNNIYAIIDINDTFVNLPVSGNVGTNDRNSDGPIGTETFTLVSGPTEGGTLVFNPDGTYVYTPLLDFVGLDIFEYQICDAGNPIACDTAKVYIRILPIDGPGNDPPIANYDTNATEKNTPVSGFVLVNDFDIDGDPIEVTANTAPTNGSVVINSDGSYIYTPNTDFLGVDFFSYTVCDDGTPALCDEALVIIIVFEGITTTSLNLTVANDDAYYGLIDEDIAGNILDNDFDPENDNQLVSASSPLFGPFNGTLVLNNDGNFTYTPNPGFVGNDQFVYQVVDDGSPVAVDYATVYFSVRNSGNTILAIDDINNTFENLTVAGNVGTNDINIDGPAGTETFTLVSGPTAGGTLVFNPDGTYTYTPLLDFVGQDTFEYQICDAGNPIACDIATVYIQVFPLDDPENDPPVANDDTNITKMDIPVAGNVLVNDFDPDGDMILVTANTTPINGNVTINPDGTYIYTPALGFTGQDTFTYSICDNGIPVLCDNAVVTIQVLPIITNITVANDDAYYGFKDLDITGNVMDNDFDPEGDNQFVTAGSPFIGPFNGTLVLNNDGSFTYTPNVGFVGNDLFVYSVIDDGTPVATNFATVYLSVNEPSNWILAIDDINNTFENLTVAGNVGTNDINIDGPVGTEIFTLVSGPTAGGTLVFNPDGTYTYTPLLDFVGQDTFEYQICDAGIPVACDIATVYIQVFPLDDPENDPPVANDDTNITKMDLPVAGNVLVNDFDPDGDMILVTANTTPINGNVTINPDGTYIYTPALGFTGQDTFTYSICDNGIPVLCDNAVVTIQVLPVLTNITVANDDAYYGFKDLDITGNVMDNDFDPEGDNQVVTAGSPFIGPFNGSLVLNNNGSFTYTPNPGFVGNDLFVYSVIDDGTPVATNFATVYLSVNEPSNWILAIDDINNTFENLTVAGNVGTNDINIDGPVGTETFTLVSGPTAGGTLVFNPDGTYTYTPLLDFVGQDTFEYQICDAGIPVACDIATVYIQVFPLNDPENDPPVANDDTNVTKMDIPVSGNVLVNDFDPDGDLIVVTTNTPPLNGNVVVNPDGTYIYTPALGFTGQDTFSYTICDNGTPVLCDDAVVTIQVLPIIINITVANDDAYFGFKDADITGNVIDNDFDPEGDNQAVTAGSPLFGPFNGTLVLNTDGSFTYTPNQGFVGNDLFIYSINDDGTPIASDHATVYLSVKTPDLTIDAVDDLVGPIAGVNVPVLNIVNVLNNDTLGGLPIIPFGAMSLDDVILTETIPDPNGFITLNPDASVDLAANTPPGTYQLTYQICAVAFPSVCDSAVVTVIVEEPEIIVTGEPYCENDTPYLHYEVQLVNFTTTQLVTIEWFDGDGNLIQTDTDLPLIGDILWPGAILDANGDIIDWPGWIYDTVNEIWIQAADGFEGLRPTATVTLSINPSETLVVEYPPGSPLCFPGPRLDANYTKVDVFCNSEATGSIDVTTSGGVAPFTFDWSTADGSGIIPGDEDQTGLTAGTYTVLVTDDLGETVLLTITIIEPDNPLSAVLDIIPANESTECTDGSATVTVSGGTGDYTYLWSVSAGSQTTATATNLPVGMHTVTITDENDCELVVEVEMTCNTASIGLIKVGTFNDEDQDECADEDETISYAFTVINNGNAIITDIMVTDPLVTVFGGPITLAPGESDAVTFTATYTITQADINDGELVNQATAAGFDPSLNLITDLSDDNSELEDDPTVTVLCQNPNIALIKTGTPGDENGNGCIDLGETIIYDFVLLNLGNVELTNVSITDPLVTVIGGPITLGALETDTETFSAIYTATQADIDAGLVSNQAIAEGTAPDGTTASDLSDDNSALEDDPTILIVCQDGAIALIKTGELNDEDEDDCGAEVGESITYTFSLTNEGNVEITDVVLTDILLGGIITGPDSGDANGDTILDLDEEWIYTANYVITQEDVTAEEIVNQASASGLDPDNDIVNDLSDDNSVLENDATITELDCAIDNVPGIGLIKEATLVDENGDNCPDVGENIFYTFIVANTSTNGTLVNVIVTDPLVTVEGGPINLAFEEVDTDSFTATYTITQEDFDSGILLNQATVFATDPVSDVLVTDLSDNDSFDENDVTVVEFCLEDETFNAISLEKSGVFNDENGDDDAEVGETLSYLFKVTNTGDTILYDITLEDELPGVIIEGGPIEELLPGESDDSTFTGSYILTELDIENLEVTNQATVTGEDEFGNEVSDDSDDPNNFDNVDNNGDGEPDDPTVTTLPQVIPAVFEIYNGITPDGDGFNDFFWIQGISAFPENNVKIFNRWGILIFETDGYEEFAGGNVFTGDADARLMIEGDRLAPTGTYFYVITFPDGAENNPFPNVNKTSYSGYLYINK